MQTFTRLTFITCLFFLTQPQSLIAQNTSPTASPSPEAQATAQQFVENEVTPAVHETKEVLSNFEFRLTLIVMALGLIALIMEFFLLRQTKNLRSEDILRVFAVTLIIIGTLFFVTVGYDANQVAPAIGLFGTVAGYILGKSSRKNDPPSES